MTLLAVLIGGAIGTALRLGIDTITPAPWGTSAINVTGAFLLGLLVSAVWPRVPHWTRAGLGTGLLGSFTTFSALAVSLVDLSADGEWMLALTDAAASVFLGLLAAWLGLLVGRRSTPVEADTE